MKKIVEKIKSCIKLMRVHHYLKNGLILLPIFFSGQLTNLNSIIKIIIAFISFSLIASLVYIINDIQDVEADKKHPVKCKRPIASGKVTKTEAIVLACVLFVTSLGLNFIIANNITSYLILLGYLAINICYSMGLKHKPIIDVLILVAGFLLRVLYGAEIINVDISNWLYLTVMCMSFYLGLGKRRNEMKKVGNDSRKVLKFYTKDFLDKNMYMFLGLTITFYSLWCMDIQAAANIKSCISLIWTVPLVIAICMKYSLNIEGDSLGDPVDVVLHDKILIAMILVYMLVLMFALYNGMSIFLV
ncbi:MAG: decaprenyl-phosphate phosphoribosyltransferase [Clostridia bacterium]